VEVETVSNNLKISRQARPNDLSTRFSTQYAVAAAIIHGHTGPEAFEPDERVAELAGRVEVRAAEDLEYSWPDAAPARVTVHTDSGVLYDRLLGMVGVGDVADLFRDGA
jgi:2-methylcitrate dehydratase PrpD